MKLTKRQKRELRAIFRRAQDLLNTNLGCCDAICLACDHEWNSQAQQYFESFFKPEIIQRLYWMCNDLEQWNCPNVFPRRLIALQLCELSLQD